LEVVHEVDENEHLILKIQENKKVSLLIITARYISISKTIKARCK